MTDDIKFTLTKVSKEEIERVKTISSHQKDRKRRTPTRKLDATEQDYLWNTYGYKHVITEDGRLIKVFKERNVMKG